MDVYYNAGFGCIVCPQTTVRNTPMRVVIDPVAVLRKGFTETALGEAILAALERSRTAPPVPRVDMGAGRFWQVTGIRGFGAFSGQFQCVDLRERGPILEAFKLIRESDGGYVWPENQPPLEVPADTPAAQMGAEILSLFSPGLEIPDNETLSFETIHGGIISYRRPSDAFADCGDGHTDAYQVFTLEDAPRSHIAFLIDSGYQELSKAAVLEKWQEQYGPLSAFRFQRRRKRPLLASMQGKTAKAEIASQIYRDGEGTMEVLCLIEQALPPEAQEAMRTEYQAVIRSIAIKERREDGSEGLVVK